MAIASQTGLRSHSQDAAFFRLSIPALIRSTLEDAPCSVAAGRQEMRPIVHPYWAQKGL